MATQKERKQNSIRKRKRKKEPRKKGEEEI